MNNEDPDWLRAIQAAHYLGVSRSTLAKWRMRHAGPPFHKLGSRLTYYLRPEIDQWLAKCDQRFKKPRPSNKIAASGGHR